MVTVLRLLEAKGMGDMTVVQRFFIFLAMLVFAGGLNAQDYVELWNERDDSRSVRPLHFLQSPQDRQGIGFARLMLDVGGSQRDFRASLVVRCNTAERDLTVPFLEMKEVYAFLLPYGACRLVAFELAGMDGSRERVELSETIFPEFRVVEGRAVYLGDVKAEVRLHGSTVEGGRRVNRYTADIVSYSNQMVGTWESALDEYGLIRDLEPVPGFDDGSVPEDPDDNIVVYKEESERPIILPGETIVVIGDPVDWCTDPGHVVIDMPAGQLDQCACGAGWEVVGSMEHDQPMCGIDWGDGGAPPDPPIPPGGGGGGRTPPDDPIEVCITAPPEPSFSEVCLEYPRDYEYQGASARCFCKCAGNSAWSKAVRGCLACEYRNGTSAQDAHETCYAAATLAGHTMPTRVLLNCATTCWRVKDFPIIMINGEVVDPFE